MLVICKNNSSARGELLKLGETYFVERIDCIDNQFYYKLKGIENTLFNYFNFDIVSELRKEKLKKLGI